MQSEQNFDQPDVVLSVTQGRHTLLLHESMSDLARGTFYFTLPDQDDYLYEYEGDLDEALDDLPEIHAVTGYSVDPFLEALNLPQVPEEVHPELPSEAVAVLEQIWQHFDQTGAQELEGQHDYDFRVEGDRLLILPKEAAGEMVIVERDGQFQSTLSPEQYEQLMERFAIANAQLQNSRHTQDNKQSFELE